MLRIWIRVGDSNFNISIIWNDQLIDLIWDKLLIRVWSLCWKIGYVFLNLVNWINFVKENWIKKCQFGTKNSNSGTFYIIRINIVTMFRWEPFILKSFPLIVVRYIVSSYIDIAPFEDTVPPSTDHLKANCRHGQTKAWGLCHRIKSLCFKQT